MELILWGGGIAASFIVGVLTGRRSKTANKLADKVQAEIDEIKARTEALRRTNGF